MIKKIYQIKALIQNYLFLQEIKYNLSVYRRVYEQEMNVNVEFEFKSLQGESAKLEDKGKNPENDLEYTKKFMKLKRTSSIQGKEKKDQATIDEIKKKINIIKDDLF